MKERKGIQWQGGEKVCVSVCVRESTHSHPCVCMEAWGWRGGAFLPYSLKQGLSLQSGWTVCSWDPIFTFRLRDLEASRHPQPADMDSGDQDFGPQVCATSVFPLSQPKKGDLFYFILKVLSLSLLPPRPRPRPTLNFKCLSKNLRHGESVLRCIL